MVVAKDRHARPAIRVIRADLEEDGGRVAGRAGVDGAADKIGRMVLRQGGNVASRVEAGEPDALAHFQELGVDLLSAQPGILIQANDLREKLARQVGLIRVGRIGRPNGGRFAEDALQDRDTPRRGRDQGLGIGAGAKCQHRQVPG